MGDKTGFELCPPKIIVVCCREEATVTSVTWRPADVNARPADVPECGQLALV
jgi:hypothetical protein